MLNNTELTKAFRQVDESVSEWSASPDPRIRWKGDLRKCLSEDVFDALESLASLAGLQNEEVHAGARRLMLYVDAFAAQWVKFTDLSQAGADVDPAGSAELWAAFNAIRDNLQPPEFKKPEPIEQLAQRENVPAWQIAKIYGWGEDVRKVQEELEKPGTHYDPKTWIHPSQVALDREIDQKWARRTPLDVPQTRVEPEAQQPAPIAPESLETLIQQRVPVEQIARMKGISISVVEQQAAMMGVVLQGARFVRPATEAGIHQEKMADEKNREVNFEREQNVKMRDSAAKKVRDLRKAGKSPAEIQELLRSEFPSLDVSQLA